ncbi:MAG: 1,4-dihydroxy-2-naphthoate polyprenyltransferase [Deltaproteobacteria bacterium]|nr:1,4-dihydroxy-2-naphthoate polyprenyltransferase [Deltaproteobacteria bacterium]
MTTSVASPEVAPPRPSLALTWLRAARPATLTAAVVPVLVGTAVAHATGGARWDTALAALLGACAIQIGTNFANDVFDAEKGADTEARLGPVRAVAAGLLSARAMRVAMIVAFAIATLFGSYLVWHVGWPIVVIGVLSIASGIAYTGGPYPLGYNGLGDVFVMLFFGFVAVLGTVLVQTAALPLLGWLASIPVGAIATAILVVNNVRDRETDVVAGKRTLVVRHGRRFGELEYVALLALAYVVPLGLAVTTSPWIALPLVSAPLAIGLVGRLRREEGAPLNATLAATAKLLLVHGVLFAAGLWLSRG